MVQYKQLVSTEKEVDLLIKSGKTTLCENTNGDSVVWSSFSLIMNISENKTYFRLAACNQCLTVFIYKTINNTVISKNCTNSLFYYINKCPKRPISSILNFLKTDESSYMKPHFA